MATQNRTVRLSAGRGHRGLIRRALTDLEPFSRSLVRVPLRPYQVEIGRAVARSISDRQGLTFTVLMPRQSGKNELSAQLEAFLLVRRRFLGGSLVKCAPTFRPQALTSIARLRRVLDGSVIAGPSRLLDGHRLHFGAASIAFYSAEPRANVVGATASVLLECDEAQDVEPDKWDRDFRPMGATANVTSVLYGTPWTDDTLLARQIAANREAESRDGIKRHFQVDWTEVAHANPEYGRYVQSEIARLGEHHPVVRTQYLLRTVAGGGRFLDATQVALLQGDHPPELGPRPSHLRPGSYVAGIDVAGEDEEDPDGLAQRVNPRRDSTVVAIAYAEHARVSDLLVEPRFHVVRLYAWRGTRHRELYPRILSLLREHWRCSSVVIDATGVGGGLAAFLAAALGPNVVTPYVYTAASKSKLAYDFLAAVNGGRFKLYAESADGAKHTCSDANDTRRELLRQAESAEYAMRTHQVMSFFVPDHRGHDDLLDAAALLVQAAPLTRIRAATGRRYPPCE